MIEHVWSVLCEQALQNPKNGAMSYINTLDELPINSVNKDTGELALKPFMIATKWKKNSEEKVKLSIKIELLGDSEENKEYLGVQEVDLDEGAAMIALNIDITKMIVQASSKFHGFEVTYKWNKQRKFRKAAMLPFSIRKPKKHKREAGKNN